MLASLIIRVSSRSQWDRVVKNPSRARTHTLMIFYVPWVEFRLAVLWSAACCLRSLKLMAGGVFGRLCGDMTYGSMTSVAAVDRLRFCRAVAASRASDCVRENVIICLPDILLQVRSLYCKCRIVVDCGSFMDQCNQCSPGHVALCCEVTLWGLIRTARLDWRVGGVSEGALTKANQGGCQPK